MKGPRGLPRIAFVVIETVVIAEMLFDTTGWADPSPPPTPRIRQQAGGMHAYLLFCSFYILAFISGKSFTSANILILCKTGKG